MSAWTYEKSGVPHLKGNPAYNRKIKRWITATKIPGVTGNKMGFASLFDMKKSGFQDPLLVAATDGVGTKLEIARMQGRHDTIGIDLVAMCVNDVVTYGAKPVFFLDYFATGKFEPKMAQEILKGIVKGCRLTGCALVGGETAIMPGFYSLGSRDEPPQYDLAGFSVGIVERKKMIDGSRIREGDVLLGMASSGVHSNGFSLLRKVLSKSQLKGRIGKELLTPTKIYVREVLTLLRKVPLLGIVHITGGGLIDNLPRVIPAGFGARIRKGSWPQPKLFHFIRDSGNISDFEMMRTFNLGIGLVLVLKRQHVRKVQKILNRMKQASWVIGEIAKGRSVEVR